MQDKSDARLLSDYAENGNETAFREIVTRHTDLIYSAALRQVNSGDLAADVTQSIFTDLARKAGSLSQKLSADASLIGWLYRGTRYASLNLRRDESRRQSYERLAMEQSLHSTETAPDWEKLRPILDEAMSELDEVDREALLLRFFKEHDFRAVGRALGVSDDAAQKRVSRAADKLREILSKRGVTTTVGTLLLVVVANAVQAAPIGLAATISASALLILSKTTATVFTSQASMNWITAKTIGAVLTTAVVVGTCTYFTQQRQLVRLRQENSNLVIQQKTLMEEKNQALATAAIKSDQLSEAQKNQLELVRLRGEVGKLRRQLSAKEAETKSAEQNAAVKPAHKPGSYISKDQLAPVGFATPEAALESFNWALLHGNYDQVAEGLGSNLLASEIKDPKGRQQFETSQAKMAPLFQGMQITAEKVLADDNVEIKFKIDYDVDAMKKLSSQLPSPFMVQLMKKENGQWKLGGGTHEYNAGWDSDGQIQSFEP